MPTVFVSAKDKPKIASLLRKLPAILAGKVADEFGIMRGFKLRMAFAFFSIIKEAYIEKSRGGTDAAGITWPKLSPEYLAYKRPMGKNGQGSRQPPVAGKLAPGGNDGFMGKKDLERWRGIYGSTLARLSLQVPVKEAKERAAMIAWADAKRRGVKTKLEVFGSRDVEILRDRGILFNSLSPGIIHEQKTDASYSKPDNQVLEMLPGVLLVGTNVEYAAHHQNGARPLWPKDGELPQVWVDEIVEVGVSGLLKIGELFK